MGSGSLLILAKWGRTVTDDTSIMMHGDFCLAVIPEGAGTVNSETGILPGLIFLLAVLRRFWARRDEALGSGIDPAGSTRSGRRSLTPTPDGARCSSGEGR